MALTSLKEPLEEQVQRGEIIINEVLILSYL